MLSVSDRTIQKAQELIAEEVARLKEILEIANPGAIPDYSMFRYYAGHIHGLHVANGFIKDAAEIAEKEASGIARAA